MAPSQSPNGVPLGVPSGLTPVNLSFMCLRDGDDITDKIANNLAPGVELLIPAGNYVLSDSTVLSYADAGDVAVRGVGGQVVFDNAGAGFNLNPTSGKVFYENLTFSNSWGVDDEIGLHPMDPGEIELNNIVIPASDGTGYLYRKPSTGHVTLRNCTTEQCTDNGVYGSPPGKVHDLGGDGSLYVLGGTWRNNNVTQVRIGSSETRVEHANIVVDGAVPLDGAGNCNARGLWIRDQGMNLYVHDVHLYQGDVACSSVAIETDDQIFQCGGSLLIDDCVIENHLVGTPTIVTNCDGYPVTVKDTKVGGAGDLSFHSDVSEYNVDRDAAHTIRTEPPYVNVDGSVTQA